MNKNKNLYVGDKVKVDTIVNGLLDGIIVAKIEVIDHPTIYNVKLNLGEFGEVVEPFKKERIRRI